MSNQEAEGQEPIRGVSTSPDEDLPLLRLEFRGGTRGRSPQFMLRRNLTHLLRFSMLDWVDDFHIVILPETPVDEPMLLLYPTDEDEAADLQCVRSVVVEQPKMGEKSQTSLVIPRLIVERIFDRSRRVKTDVDSYSTKNHLLFSPIISYITPEGELASGIIALWPLGYENEISSKYPYPRRPVSSTQSTLS
jgi:hypothetical protein